MQHSHIAIIGAPLDLGQDRRGVDMGPSAIRVANLNKRLAALGYHADDLGNVPVDQPESLPEGPDRAKYLPQIALACKRLALMVDRALTKKKVPLVLGGDHSVAVGTVAGVSRHFRRKKQEKRLIWIDAHADMNTPETSPSGNVHGMPLACCVGLGPPELTNLLATRPKLARVGDQHETRHAEIIPAIVGEERRTRQQRGGSDPGIGAFDPSSGGLRSDRNLRPLRAQLTVIWEDDKAFNVLPQSRPARLPPTR